MLETPLTKLSAFDRASLIGTYNPGSGADTVRTSTDVLHHPYRVESPVYSGPEVSKVNQLFGCDLSSDVSQVNGSP